MYKFFFFLTGCCILLLSCEEVLVPNITDELVVLTAPTDGVITGDSIQRFAWQPVRFGTVYQLQIVSETFDSIVKLYVDTTTAESSIRLTMEKGKKYQWRVKALNDSYSSSYSTPANLVIQ